MEKLVFSFRRKNSDASKEVILYEEFSAVPIRALICSPMKLNLIWKHFNEFKRKDIQSQIESVRRRKNSTSNSPNARYNSVVVSFLKY